MDLAARRVTVATGQSSTDVRLTPTEWHLLEVLLRHPGKLLSQRQLLAEVWGPGYETAGGQPAGLHGAAAAQARAGPGAPAPPAHRARHGLPLPAGAAGRLQRVTTARFLACWRTTCPSGPPTAGHQPGVMGQGGRGGTLTWCTTWWTTWCTTTSTGATATSTVPCTLVAPDPLPLDHLSGDPDGQAGADRRRGRERGRDDRATHQLGDGGAQHGHPARDRLPGHRPDVRADHQVAARGWPAFLHGRKPLVATLHRHVLMVRPSPAPVQPLHHLSRR